MTESLTSLPLGGGSQVISTYLKLKLFVPTLPTLYLLFWFLKGFQNQEI